MISVSINCLSVSSNSQHADCHLLSNSSDNDELYLPVSWIHTEVGKTPRTHNQDSVFISLCLGSNLVLKGASFRIRGQLPVNTKEKRERERRRDRMGEGKGKRDGDNVLFFLKVKRNTEWGMKKRLKG